MNVVCVVVTYTLIGIGVPLGVSHLIFRTAHSTPLHSHLTFSSLLSLLHWSLIHISVSLFFVLCSQPLLQFRPPLLSPPPSHPLVPIFAGDSEFLEMGSPGNPSWVLDYGYLDDITVPCFDSVSDPPNFSWSSPVPAPPTLSVELDDSYGNSDGFKESGSRKRLRSAGSSNPSGSKACREKMRRDRLNDRFLELSTILDPGRPPKMDKAVILSDAVRTVSQLREEAQKLRESTENLQEKINELKAEKNELRDEKQRLKAEKDNLEQQLKAFTSQPGFMHHPPTLPAAFPAAPGQVVGSKVVPFMGYPGVSMWQFLPPGAVDTSQDHVLRPPVA